jgi:hypothetical protein
MYDAAREGRDTCGSAAACVCGCCQWRGLCVTCQMPSESIPARVGRMSPQEI